MTVQTFPAPSDWLHDLRDMLREERRALRQRLSEVNSDPHMGILEKAAERRALRERLAEIDTEEIA